MTPSNESIKKKKIPTEYLWVVACRSGQKGTLSNILEVASWVLGNIFNIFHHFIDQNNHQTNQ